MNSFDISPLKFVFMWYWNIQERFKIMQMIVTKLTSQLFTKALTCVLWSDSLSQSHGKADIDIISAWQNYSWILTGNWMVNILYLCMQSMWIGILVRLFLGIIFCKAETVAESIIIILMIIFHCSQLLDPSWTSSYFLAFSLYFLWILTQDSWVRSKIRNTTIETRFKS